LLPLLSTHITHSFFFSSALCVCVFSRKPFF
jgi:hypothetical protein